MDSLTSFSASSHVEAARQHSILIYFFDKICVILDEGFIWILLDQLVILVGYYNDGFFGAHVVSQIINVFLYVFETF